MKKVIKADLDQFSHEQFNEHYNTLIDLGNLNDEHETQIFKTLGFLKNLQELVENLKKDFAENPDGCQSLTEQEDEQSNRNDKALHGANQMFQFLENIKTNKTSNQQKPRKIQVCK